MGFGVRCLESGWEGAVLGLGLRVWSVESGVWGLGFGDWGWGFGIRVGEYSACEDRMPHPIERPVQGSGSRGQG